MAAFHFKASDVGGTLFPSQPFSPASFLHF